MERNKILFEKKRSALKDNFLKRLKNIVGEQKIISIEDLFSIASEKSENKEFNSEYAKLANEYIKEYNAFMNENRIYWEQGVPPQKPTD